MISTSFSGRRAYLSGIHWWFIIVPMRMFYFMGNTGSPSKEKNHLLLKLSGKGRAWDSPKQFMEEKLYFDLFYLMGKHWHPILRSHLLLVLPGKCRALKAQSNLGSKTIFLSFCRQKLHCQPPLCALAFSNSNFLLPSLWGLNFFTSRKIGAK